MPANRPPSGYGGATTLTTGASSGLGAQLARQQRHLPAHRQPGRRRAGGAARLRPRRHDRHPGTAHPLPGPEPPVRPSHGHGPDGRPDARTGRQPHRQVMTRSGGGWPARPSLPGRRASFAPIRSFELGGRDSSSRCPAITSARPGSSGTSPKHAQPELKVQTPAERRCVAPRPREWTPDDMVSSKHWPSTSSKNSAVRTHWLWVHSVHGHAYPFRFRYGRRD